MLDKIIDSLNTDLKSLGYFNKQYCLCEKIKQGDKQYPATQKGKSEWVQVSAFDKHEGTSYWRKRGNVSINESEVQVIPNQLFIDVTYPLYLIVCVNKKKLNDISAYADEKIAIDIYKVLTTDSNSTLRANLSAFRASVKVTEYNTIGHEVFEQEYDGVSDVDVNYDYSYISLNVDVVVTIRQSCLETEC